MSLVAPLGFVAFSASARSRRTLSFSRSWELRCRHRDWSTRSTRAPYYVDNFAAADLVARPWEALPRDASGVVLTLGGTYHARRIAQFALVEYGRFARDRDALESFLAQATWLRDESWRQTDGAYAMPSASVRYRSPAGYRSATIQGIAISALLRAHEIDPSAGYLAAAERAALPFRSRIEDGGVVWRSVAGDAFLEDVATSPACHGLAGFLLAFVGVFELQRYVHRDWLGELVGAAVGTLQRRLGYFDAGYWSFEDACVGEGGRRELAPLRVHDTHVALLRVCASMTGDRYFVAMADAWSACVTDPAARRRVAKAVRTHAEWSSTAF